MKRIFARGSGPDWRLPGQPPTCRRSAALSAGRGPVYNPIYNWTGFYIGINGGGGWGDSQWDGVNNFDVVRRPDRRHHRLQLAVRPVRGRRRRRHRLVGRQRHHDALCARRLRNAQQLARHHARPPRLRLRPVHALHHRRSRRRRHQATRRAFRAAAPPMRAGPWAPASKSASSAMSASRPNICTWISATSIAASTAASLPTATCPTTPTSCAAVSTSGSDHRQRRH